MDDDHRVWSIAVIAVAAVVIVLILTIGFTAMMTKDTDKLPRCGENTVIEGHGEYTDGRWETYSCVPVEQDPL